MDYLEIELNKDNEPEDIGNSLKNKLRVLYVICILAVCILVSRLFYLQVIKNSYYKKLSRSNKEQIIPIPAYRGEIYDRNGVILSENVKAYTMYLVPVNMPKNFFEKEELLHRVSKVFNIDLGEIKNRLKKFPANSYESVEISESITMPQISYLAERAEEYPGVYYSSKSIRNYPEGNTLTHILGYIGNISPDEYRLKREEGYRKDSVVGKEGVEQFYDKELRGIDGFVQWIVDSRNRVKETITPSTGKPVPGKKLVLSIDADVQRNAEEFMKELVGTIIVSKPTTGEIIAMVSSPWYDPNIFIGRIDKEKYNELLNNPANPFWNKAIRGRYPPASTFKLISAVGLLNENRVSLNTTKYCGGGMYIENRFYKCEGVHGNVNFYSAIQYSCNTYFYNLAYEVGPNFIRKYAELFGFADSTGIDLPGEKIGTVPSPDWKRRRVGEYWWDGDTIHYVIGQGFMSATPIAVHMSTSAIINDGKMYRPHVVKEIRSSQTDEVIYNNDRVVIKTLDIDKAVFNAVKEGMRRSAEGGTSRVLAHPTIKMAGKTGTAENASGKSHSWITAFGPYDTNPNDNMYAVTVMLEHGGGGGLNAGPIAAAMLRYLINGENPQAVRNDIYYRLNRAREQAALARQRAREQASGEANNSEQNDFSANESDADERVKYE